MRATSKYDREHDIDIILGSVLPCRKLKLMCRKNSNDVVRQVDISCKLTNL